MTCFIHDTLSQRVILDAGRARAAGRGGRAPQGHRRDADRHRGRRTARRVIDGLRPTT
jgi:hypothetical protein